ncbi:MAG: serine hydrolase domain-containing protein [Myxococcota bacterium]
MTGPEGLIRVHVLEAPGGAGVDLERLIAEGWPQVSPSMDLEPRSSVAGAPNERFRAQRIVSYADDENRRFAQGVALHHVTQDRVYLVFVEGPTKAIDKRGAALRELLGSLEVDGANKLTVDPAARVPFDGAAQTRFFSFVAQARKDAGVPGVTVAVVTPEGSYVRGFGTTGLGPRARPVGPATQFMIGSITKSFSTALIATLVDDGKLSWTTPVKKAYAAFGLADDRADAMEMQHLFCACVGAARNDLEMLFEFSRKRPQDVFAEVKALELTTAFGEAFQYNNQLTAAGGYIAGHVATGGAPGLASYRTALRRRILDPLGMRDTQLSMASVVARGDHAVPHGVDAASNPEALPLELEAFVRPYAPAGALWSTADDMVKYLRFQLAQGKNEAGETVVSGPQLARTQTAGVPLSDALGYGMGWVVGTHRGLRVIEHSGGTMGFNSDVVVFPEIGVGFFISSNRSPASITKGVRARLLEVLFSLEPRAEAQLAHQLEEAKRQREALLATTDDTPVATELLGTYAHPRLGRVVVRRRGERTELDAGEWSAEVRNVRPDERDGAILVVTGPLRGLTVLADAEASTLTIRHQQKEYVLTKRSR